MKIVEDCLELEAVNRPTMQEVTDRLTTVLNLGGVLDHVMHWLPTAIVMIQFHSELHHPLCELNFLARRTSMVRLWVFFIVHLTASPIY